MDRGGVAVTYSAPGIRTYSTRPDLGGAFTPTDIAGLQLWLKADSLSLSDNDPISTWTDSSGNGNNATGTLTARPLYKTNIINSLPVVRFDGSNDNLVITDVNGLDLTGDQSIFVVMSTSDATGAIVSHHNSGAPFTGWTFAVGIITPANNNKLAYWSNGKGSWVNDAGTTAANGSPHLASVIRTSGSITFYTDGTAGSTNTGHSNGSSSANIFLGQTADGLNVLAGDIAEILVYDSALSGGNLTNVKSYIAAKYALTIA